MTLIAAIYDQGTFILLTDTLITTKNAHPTAQSSIPGWKGLPAPEQVHIAGLMRKMYALDPFSVIMWSGTEVYARAFISEITELHERNRNFSPEDARSIVERHASDHIDFIITLIRESYVDVVYSSGCTEIDIPGFGRTVVGGSGSAGFFQLIQPNSEGEYEFSPSMPNAATPEQLLFRKAAYLDSKFMSLQTSSTLQLQERWGGIMDVWLTTPSGIAPMPSVSHAHSLIVERSGKPELIPYYYVVSKRSTSSGLAVWEYEPASKSAKFYLIPSILSPGKLAQSAVGQLIGKPNPAWQSNVVQAQLISGHTTKISWGMAKPSSIIFPKSYHGKNKINKLQKEELAQLLSLGSALLPQS